MMQFFKSIVIVSLLGSQCWAITPFWYSVQLEGGVSIPTYQVIPKLRAMRHLYTAGSIVKVKEHSRQVVSNIKDRNSSSDTVTLEPNKVRLKYQIEHVYSGDGSLHGQFASATAWRRSGKDLTPYPPYIAFLPEENDQGIWYVNQLNGELICVKVNLAGITFPIFESGAHNFGMHNRRLQSRLIDYREVVEFAEELEKYANNRVKTNIDWKTLCQAPNSIVALWAVWQLCLDTHEIGVDDLRSVCSSPMVDTMAQSVADDFLLRSDDSWCDSPERQKMVRNWYSLPVDDMSEVLNKYINPNHLPDGLRGFELENLRDLTKSALDKSIPNTRKHRFFTFKLNSIIGTVP